ncbi:ctp synthase protein [Rutstroemia sp. NJR-2017a WRK4]|nr:ctp synthase protein [Rutstroemia sp. NJR-2017a WRK4]
MKYVLVSGGVISGIGKGVIDVARYGENHTDELAATASSTGLLLKTIGLKICFACTILRELLS